MFFGWFNQSMFIFVLYTNTRLDMLMFEEGEQSMDSQRHAYFHDRQNISLVQIDGVWFYKYVSHFSLFLDGFDGFSR